MTDLPACREAFHRHLDELGYRSHEVIYSDAGYRDHTLELRWQGFQAAWNRIDHPEGGGAVASDNLMIRNPCPNAAPVVSPSKTVTVQLGQPSWRPHETEMTPLRPRTPSVDVETLKALVERWREGLHNSSEWDDGRNAGLEMCADELEAAIKRGEVGNG